MKKDRNCGSPYPVYPYPMPNMGGPMVMSPNMGVNYNPGMSPNMGVNYNPGMSPTMDPNMMNSTSNTLSTQVNNLEKRVTALESMLGNNYNSSNFQIM